MKPPKLIYLILLVILAACAPQQNSTNPTYNADFERDFATGLEAVAEYVVDGPRKMVLLDINNPSLMYIQVWMSQEYSTRTESITRRNMVYSGFDSNIRKLIKIRQIDKDINESIKFNILSNDGKSILKLDVNGTIQIDRFTF